MPNYTSWKDLILFNFYDMFTESDINYYIDIDNILIDIHSYL